MTQSKNENLISIVIPTLNEELNLTNLLTCIKNQTFGNIEIIVSDAKSKDCTVPIAKEFGCKIVEGGNQSQGRNKGARIAKGEIIIFMDADIQFDTYFVEKSINEFNKRGLDIATTFYNKSNISRAGKFVFSIGDFLKKRSENSNSPFGTGELIIIRKNILEKVAQFDENLVLGEDVRFIRKTASLGYKYGILSTQFTPSDRRIRKYGVARVLIGGFLGEMITFTRLSNAKRLKKISYKLYGGWGKW